MRNLIKTGSKALLALFLISNYTLAQAADNTAAPVNSNAVQFAVEAGNVAGTAQGCGQDISVLISRVNEAITKLAASPGDKVIATATFQKTLQQAQLQEINNHAIPCSQVTADYNSTHLPILRSDYQQSVIAQLNPGMTGGQQPQSAPTPNTNNTNPAPMGPSDLTPSSSSGSDNNTMPSMPNNSTTPPPASTYNQNNLPGAQQQQMNPEPATNPTNNPTTPASVMPSAPVNNNNNTPPPDNTGQ